MHLNPHVGFDGNCREAMAFYEDVFNTRVQMIMSWRDSPLSHQMPLELQDQIMHASIKVGSSTLMAADAPPGRYQKPQGITISLELQDKAEAERVFNTLAAAGSVEMPFQETFWAYGFGMLHDKFAVAWMVNCAKPIPTA